jgi:hypothetical protein
VQRTPPRDDGSLGQSAEERDGIRPMNFAGTRSLMDDKQIIA